MGTCDDQKPKSPGATVLAPQRVPQALPASSSHLSTCPASDNHFFDACVHSTTVAITERRE